jgi:threonine/homoserine/homoserine lactone efflux protein
MNDYVSFAAGYAFVCVVQPGPFQAYILSQCMTKSWRKTFPLAFAPLISDIPVILTVLFVLSKLPQQALPVLQFCGGAYLLYLSVSVYKEWRNYIINKAKEVRIQESFIKAVFVNLINPNPYLGWSLVMGPLLIKTWETGTVAGVLLLITFYGTMIVCTLGMILLFSFARNLGGGISRMALLFSSVALVFFGFYLIWSGASGF